MSEFIGEKRGSKTIKEGFCKLLKGGVIMDVVNEEQARIAEEAGAIAVMALDKIPSELRKLNGVARMADPALIRRIMDSVSIPVMAKCRIGHFAEARILEALKVDCIDESEVLTLADPLLHVNKHDFSIPFVCGCRNLSEALRRVEEGASMLRTKGEAGTGNIIEAVRHMRDLNREIAYISGLRDDELFFKAKEMGVNYDLLRYVHENKRLPVVNFAAGGIATPADAVLMMHLGCDGVFVGSGIFSSSNPSKRASAIVRAVHNYTDWNLIAELSCEIGTAMDGIGELDKSDVNFRSRDE